MKFIIINVFLGLFGLAVAAPADLDAGAKHAARATSAEITKFSVSCSASSCSYTARAVILPENVAVNFTHTTSGPTIPKNTGFFDSSDPAVYFHINRATDIYRIVLSDAHVVGSAVNLAIITPGEAWTAKSYTGPSSFTLS